MKAQVEHEIRDFTMDMAQEIVHNARPLLLESIAKIINQHNMTDTKYGRLDGRTLERLMEENDEGGADDLAFEIGSDIEVALSEYAQKLGQFAVHVVSSRER